MSGMEVCREPKFHLDGILRLSAGDAEFCEMPMTNQRLIERDDELRQKEVFGAKWSALRALTSYAKLVR